MLEDAGRNHHAVSGIDTVVSHKSRHFADDGHVVLLNQLRHLLGVGHALVAPHCNVHSFSLPPSHTGGLLEWDMWARIDRNRLPRPLKYAPFRPQIRLSRVAIGPPPRHQQTTDTACCDEVDPCSILESWMLTPKTSERRSSKPSKGAP